MGAPGNQGSCAPRAQKKGNPALVVILVIVGVLVTAGIGVGIWWFTSGSKTEQAETESAFDAYGEGYTETTEVVETPESTLPDVSNLNPYDKDDFPEVYDYRWYVCDRELTIDEVASAPQGVLRIWLNTIYAAHGYDFNTPSLAAYFSGFDWYFPVTKVVPVEEFTPTELHNINLIKKYQN